MNTVVSCGTLHNMWRVRIVWCLRHSTYIDTLCLKRHPALRRKSGRSGRDAEFFFTGSFFQLNSLACFSGNIFGSYAVHLEQRRNLTGTTEAILDADPENGNGICFCGGGTYSFTETLR